MNASSTIIELVHKWKVTWDRIAFLQVHHPGRPNSYEWKRSSRICNNCIWWKNRRIKKTNFIDELHKKCYLWILSFRRDFYHLRSCMYANFNLRNLRVNSFFWVSDRKNWRFGWKNSISAGNYVADHYIIISFCLPTLLSTRATVSASIVIFGELYRVACLQLTLFTTPTACNWANNNSNGKNSRKTIKQQTW